ncbi:MAG: hypothetical protein RDU76_02600 [Candidatus Edwardsbacteria bacterium]|nr:hypothetical protein [Candidatus Edwardsbacteria bacterium]
MAAKYYAVKKVLELAQRIGPATEKMFYVKNDEVLVGIVQGSKYAIAADLTDKREYLAFYQACQKGHWVDIELYRMSKEEAESCPDQGRMTIEDLKAQDKKTPPIDRAKKK